MMKVVHGVCISAIHGIIPIKGVSLGSISNIPSIVVVRSLGQSVGSAARASGSGIDRSGGGESCCYELMISNMAETI